MTGSSAPQRQHLLECRIPPPVVGGALAIIMAGLTRLSPAWPWPAGGPVVLWLSLVVLGLTFDAQGLWRFWQRKTSINPWALQNTRALVTHGIYRYTRNPMYVGMLLLLLAWAVYLGHVITLLGPVAYVLFLNRFQITPEERYLTQVFGDDYRRYCQHVRRWL